MCFICVGRRLNTFTNAFKANSKEAIENKITRLYDALKNNASMKIEHFESVYRLISILTTKLNNLR